MSGRAFESKALVAVLYSVDLFHKVSLHVMAHVPRKGVGIARGLG